MTVCIAGFDVPLFLCWQWAAAGRTDAESTSRTGRADSPADEPRRAGQRARGGREQPTAAAPTELASRPFPSG
ncbi:hypothetical protein E2C01_049852 [Portunus trituberculatus]|uniref:Uncharacterized protein n=1 Tax=Portunus trituberculatus TaxID=210409 RepID=A0A5B7GFF5_PORTR|nr:hypothetical protein [Portunus trituberculatus]